MKADYEIIKQHGFTIAWTHGKVLQMLKDNDYNTLQQCETLEDVIVKLSSTSYQKYLTEEVIQTKKAFKTQLQKSLLNEFQYLYKNSPDDLKIILDFFRNHFRIQNFVYLLASKEEDFSLEHTYDKIDKIGDYNELCAIKIATDMHDVYKFCVENTFLMKYYTRIKFEREIKANDMQVVQSLLLKYLLEDVFDNIKDQPGMYSMIDILKIEGDRRIIEIVLNTLDSTDVVGKKRLRLFPKVTSIDMGMLGKLGACTSMDELRGIVSGHPQLRKVITVEDDEIINILTGLEVEKYWNSFGIFNDISCIYSYLRLKEQEIKNILWTVDCISLKKKDFIKNVILPKNTVE